jgi:hypothetical protein
VGDAPRLAAAKRGEFTLGELLRWAHEVDLVDGSSGSSPRCPPTAVLARAPFEAVALSVVSPRLEAWDYGCGRCAPTGKIDEDGRSSRRFSRKGGSIGRPFAVLGAKRLVVKAAGELGALALARATERVVGLDLDLGQSSVRNDETKSRVRLPRAEARQGGSGCPRLIVSARCQRRCVRPAGFNCDRHLVTV